MTFFRGYRGDHPGRVAREPAARLVAIFAVDACSTSRAGRSSALVLKRITDAVVGATTRARRRSPRWSSPLLGARQHDRRARPARALRRARRHERDPADAARSPSSRTGPPGWRTSSGRTTPNKLELIRNEGTWRYMSVRSAVTSVGVLVQSVLTVLLLARLQPDPAPAPAVRASRRSSARGSRGATSSACGRGHADKLRRAEHYSDLALRADAAQGGASLRARGRAAAPHPRRRGREIQRALFRADLRGVLRDVGRLARSSGSAYVGALLLVVRGAVRRRAHDRRRGARRRARGSDEPALVDDVVASLQRLQRECGGRRPDALAARAASATPLSAARAPGLRSRPARARDPPRGRRLRVSGRRDATCSRDVDLRAAGRLDRRARRRERRRQVDARQAALPLLRADDGRDPRRRRRPARASSRRVARAGSRPASRTSCASSCSRARASASATCRTSRTRRRCEAAVERGAARDVVADAAATGSRRRSARRYDGRRRALRRPVAEARARPGDDARARRCC